MFKELLEQTNHLPEKNALLKTTYLNQVSHVQTRDTLKASYQHSDINMKLMGTIFNAIITENKSTFWLSRSILENLLTQDKHASRETLSGTTYKDFIEFVLTNNLLEQRRIGGSIRGQKVPSVFRLKDSHLLGMFDACCVHNWRKSIDDHACEKWDSLYISTTCDEGSPSKSPEKKKEKKKEEVISLQEKTTNNNWSAPKSVPVMNLISRPIPTPGPTSSNASQAPICSPEEVLFSWQASLPKAPKQKDREDAFFTVLSNLKEQCGFTFNDVTPGMKKKIITKFVPEIRPKGTTSEKFETWKRMVNEDFENQMANVFVQPTELKQAPVVGFKEAPAMTEDQLNEEHFERASRGFKIRN